MPFVPTIGQTCLWVRGQYAFQVKYLGRATCTPDGGKDELEVAFVEMANGEQIRIPLDQLRELPAKADV